MFTSIAIIGRPNVGKSSLFNKLTKSRDAIVSDFPGLTKDRNHGFIKFKNRDILLVDTGGIVNKKETMKEAISHQAWLAAEESSMIILLLDSSEDLNKEDIDIINNRFVPKGDLLIEKNYTENGIYSQLFYWMKKNSKKYGFYLVYDDSPKRKGFKFEPWHYSYKPLSVIFLRRFIERNLLFKITQDSSLLGRQFIHDSFLESYLKENILDVSIDLK